MDDIDREVDESTDVCTRIDESILKIRGYINAHGNSIATRTDAQYPVLEIRPPPVISTPPQQPSQIISESSVSRRSSNNGTN